MIFKKIELKNIVIKRLCDCLFLTLVNNNNNNNIYYPVTGIKKKIYK